ncbi:MAG TPA: BNR repeat-containing protein [Tepidisphaeraceae bacterium]|jgi:hypothetical protein|nr:BNR repeat-containing protein [Tepidisphaeraceae bacterium]
MKSVLTFVLAVALSAVMAKGRLAEVVDIAPVWSGHPVGFALLTQGEKQYVAYYDDQRRMVVAEREVSSKEWTKKVLPVSVKWDSHNYITMTFDDQGQLHVSGDMHAVPLVYFRTTRAGDVTSLVRVEHMIGTQEMKCTYPRFFRGPGNELIFTYRDGGSGNGNQIYNVYDGEKWKRLIDGPLTDGQGKRNAYLIGPTKGPDGYWHLVWVWRESPDCSTNHTLAYARSKDLRHWEKGDGTPLLLPMTLANEDIVDPVPQHGGIVNGNTVIGFDAQKRVVIGYHKYDAAGNTQIYNARLEDGKWKIYQASDWGYRWDFGGKGSIAFEVGLGPVHEDHGVLTQTWRNVKYGSGTWKLDEKTLKVVGTVKPVAQASSDSLGAVESKVAGMSVKSAGDSGKAEEKGVRYVLRWETLGVNRDKPREGEPPAPTMLRVYKFEQ